MALKATSLKRYPRGCCGSVCGASARARLTTCAPTDAPLLGPSSVVSQSKASLSEQPRAAATKSSAEYPLPTPKSQIPFLAEIFKLGLRCSSGRPLLDERQNATAS